MLGIAIGVALAAYLVALRPLVASRVDRYPGWEHGLITIAALGAAVLLLQRTSRPVAPPPPAGRRHRQVRVAIVDDAFGDAVEAYDRYVSSGRERDAVALRLARHLARGGGLDAAAAERLVDGTLPKDHGPAAMARARRDARAQAVDELLARAEEDARPSRPIPITASSGGST